MDVKTLLAPILGDDNLTRGLGDAEARILVEWLVERAEAQHVAVAPEQAHGHVVDLCRRARAISRFVSLWCHQHSHGAACQLAATQRFAFPLPCTDVDPCDLMLDILQWEARGNI
jgi:hypothetical protein